MAKDDNYIGIAMGLDITDLKTGLQETKKAITTANKEFYNATAGLDDWQHSVEGLTAKEKQLDKILEQQRKIVAGYTAELEQAKKKYGENSEQVRRLRDKLLDADTQLKKTEKNIRKNAEALNSMKTATAQASNETGKLSSGLKGSSGGFSVLKGAMSGLLAGGLLSGVSSAFSSITNLLEESVDISKDWRKEMSYLRLTAQEVGMAEDYVLSKIDDLGGILDKNGKAVEGFNHVLEAGFIESDIDEVLDNLVGATLKFNDIRFENIAKGVRETVRLGEASGDFRTVLERLNISVDTFDDMMITATTQEERQQVVLKALAQSGLKAVRDAYVENNEELLAGIKAENDYTYNMAVLGEKIEPIFNAIRQGFVDVLGAIVQVDDEFKAQEWKETIQETFAWFIEDCVPVIRGFIQFLLDSKDAVPEFFSGMADGIGQFADDTVSFFAGLPDQFADIGGQIMDGLINGMMEVDVWGTITDIGGSILDGFKGFFGIHSPSRVMRDEVGKMLGLGIGEGLTSSIPSVKKSINGFNKDIQGSMLEGYSGRGAIIYNQTINSPKALSRLDIYRQTRNLLDR